MSSYRNHTQLSVSRERLIVVMKELARDLHIIISTGTTCCGSCGSRSLLESLESHKNAHLCGYLFWHIQKDDQFKHGGELGLHHGHRNDNRRFGIALATKICKGLKQRGVGYRWSGNENECIMVPIEKEPGFAQRREAGWRRMMIENGEDPDEDDEAQDGMQEEEEEEEDDETMDVLD